MSRLPAGGYHGRLASPVSLEAAFLATFDTHHGLDYGHRVRSLDADRRSAEAPGIHGLAVLATRIAVDDDTSTEARTSNLDKVEDAAGANQMCCARFDHCPAATDLLHDALDNLQANVHGRALEQLMAVPP